MTDPTISHTGQTLKIGNREVKLEEEIRQTLVYDDLVVVRMELPGQTDVRDNVVAYDFDSRCVWKIEPVTTADHDGSLIYVNIRETDGKLVADNWNGASYEVDPETGSVELHNDPRSV